MTSTFSTLRFRGRGEKPKVFYATQLGVSPPTFLLFVNRKKLFTKEAMRAVERDLSKRLGFGPVPLRLVLRERRAQRVQEGLESVHARPAPCPPGDRPPRRRRCLFLVPRLLLGTRSRSGWNSSWTRHRRAATC